MRKVALLTLLFFNSLCFAVKSEPIAHGVVIETCIYVYSDSSYSSTVIDTLHFADHAVIIGITENSSNNYNSNGWCKIELPDKKQGWARYNSIAVSDVIISEIAKDKVIFSEPDTNSAILTTIDENYYIRIFDRCQYDGYCWLKIRYENWSSPRTEGWIKTDELRFQAGETYYALIKNFLHGSNSFLNLKSQITDENALVLSDKFKEIVTSTDSVYMESWLGNYTPLGSYAVAAYVKHQVFLKMTLYQNAIQSLQKIVENYNDQRLFNGKAGTQAAFEIGKILKDNVRDTTSAVTQFHYVINNYPGETLEGFEWNTWVDISSGWMIIGLLENNFQKLFENCQQIINESDNPPVDLVGYTGIVKSLGGRELSDQMVDTTISALDNFSETKLYFFKDQIDFRKELVTTVYLILEKHAQVSKYKEFAETIINRYSDEDIAIYSKLKLAELADITNEDVATVISLYENLLHISSDYSYFCQSRISQLNEISPFLKGKIIGENVNLKLGRGEQYSNISDLRAGNYVNILYNDEIISSIFQYTPYYTKVVFQDSMIGWLPTKNLKIIQPEIFYEEKSSETEWNMCLANSENNLVFDGPEIENPVISNVFFNYRTDDIRFHDINEDNILDFVVRRNDSGNSEIVAIDGKTQEIIWRVDKNYYNYAQYNNPIIAKGKIFFKQWKTIISNFPVIRKMCLLNCFDLKNGDFLWSLPTSKDYDFAALYFNDCIYDVCDDSLVSCIDLDDGKNIWTARIGESANYAIAVNQKALIVSTDDSLYALAPNTGQLLWKHVNTYYANTPIIDESQVYFLYTDSRYGFHENITALNIETGDTTWSVRNINTLGYQNTLIVKGNNIFHASENKLCARDKFNGSIVWRQGYSFNIKYFLAVGNSLYMYGYGDTGVLGSVSQIDGSLQWEMPLSLTSELVYENGNLFVDGASGTLVITDSTKTAHLNTPSEKYYLFQNYPNPFNQQTKIVYELNENQSVNLNIYNIMGQRIKQVVNCFQYKGIYTVTWDGTTDSATRVSSGIYLCQLKIGNKSSVKRILLIK